MKDMLALSVLLQNYPDCASWTKANESQYIDIDQQSACLTGYDQKYRQLSSGQYHGWFQTVLLGSQIGLYFETFNQMLDQWGACPSGHYAFIFLMDGSSEGLINSEHFGADCILYLTPGSGFDCSSGPGTRFCVISVADGVFELFLRACLPEDDWVDITTISSRIIRNRLNVGTLRQMMHQAVKLADDFGGTPTDKGALTGFQTSLVSLLASYVSGASLTQYSNHDGQSDLKTKPAFAARDYLHTTGAAHISVTDLVNRVGVSRRKLEYAFRSQFDKSPAEYIRLVQLNEIRSALLDEANQNLSIGDIAARYGIWHLSRLAQYYRTQFGELPSETRKPCK